MPIGISFTAGNRSSIGLTIPANPGAMIFVVAEVPAGLVNGSNMDYTTAFNYSQLWVYRNGVRQKPSEDYTETGANSFQFVTPPLTGDLLLVDYIK